MRRELLRSGDGAVSGVLIFGEEARADLPLLVFIHGGGCSSAYFELTGFSTVAIASEARFPMLLVNRPGYGGNCDLEADRPLIATATMVRNFAEQVRQAHISESSGVAIVGHSIGGAIALLIASQRGDWPLRGLAVSGIGDVPTAEAVERISASRADHVMQEELSSSFFLGPVGSYTWKAPIALRSAAEPWLMAEVLDVVERWPAEWPEVAARIDVPVHLRLAEHESIWETGRTAVGRMAHQMSRAPLVDAAILPDGGHLYEIHKRGPDLIRSQLAFLAEVAQRA